VPEAILQTAVTVAVFAAIYFGCLMVLKKNRACFQALDVLPARSLTCPEQRIMVWFMWRFMPPSMPVQKVYLFAHQFRL
jgi:hypothetical protein